MQKSSFWNAELVGYDAQNNPIYDKEFYAEDFSAFVASFVGNGVYPNPATNLQVMSLDSNMVLTVDIGKAWMLGRFYQNTEQVKLTLSPADGVLHRIDRVVLRMNYSARDITVQVKKGTLASTPVAQSLQRDADIYEFALADVSVRAGSIKIVTSDITDQRLNTQLCGVATGVLQQVDTSEIFRQYKAWFDTKVIEYGQNFSQFEQSQKDMLANFVTQFKNSLDPASDVAIQLNVKISEVKTTADKNTQDVASEKVKLRDAMKLKKAVVIPKIGWAFDAAIACYKCRITDSDITADTVVDVNIRLADMEKAGDLKGVTESFAGYVELYSDAIPTADLICDMKLQKQVI